VIISSPSPVTPSRLHRCQPHDTGRSLAEVRHRIGIFITDDTKRCKQLQQLIGVEDDTFAPGDPDTTIDRGETVSRNNAIEADSGASAVATPFDPAEDEPTDAYFEGFAFWGLGVPRCPFLASAAEGFPGPRRKLRTRG
jgi:hypothetical protein